MKQSLYEPQHEILIQVLTIVKKPQEASHLALTLHLIWVLGNISYVYTLHLRTSG